MTSKTRNVSFSYIIKETTMGKDTNQPASQTPTSTVSTLGTLLETVVGVPALPLQPMDSKALDRTIAAYRTNAEAFKEQYGEIVRNFAEAVYTAYTQTTYQYEWYNKERCPRFYTRQDVDNGSYVCFEGLFSTPGKIGRDYRQTTAHFDGKVINDLLKSLDYYTPGSVCEPMPTLDFNKRAEEKLAFVESFLLGLTCSPSLVQS
jgi:hypothetical protein